ncbi:MAG: leucine-rich repeat domain-containing protein, partial [Peptococcaceae bacterium]|nr:leucine-rich repeat domain-containing protein [Peptococcaceae bacterium]
CAEEVVKLGVHICRALELCAQDNIIHRDIKPENIFITHEGDYKLGDFGVAKQIENTMGGVSKKGSYSTMAPEVFRGEHYGTGVDIYGLGIVMYTLLNKNRAPFMPAYPQSITPIDREFSMEKRMSGEPIPEIKGVSPALNAIVLKACAADRQDRFSGPGAMREALESLENYANTGQAANHASDQEASDHEEMENHLAGLGKVHRIEKGVHGSIWNMECEESEGDAGHEISNLGGENQEPDREQDQKPVQGQDREPDQEPDQEQDQGQDQAHDQEQDQGQDQEQDREPVQGQDQEPVGDKERGSAKRKFPLVITVSLVVAVLALLAVAWIGFGSDVDDVIRDPDTLVREGVGYGITINGQNEFAVSTRKGAETILDDLKDYYIRVSAATADKIQSVEFEEAVEVVELQVNEDNEVILGEDDARKNDSQKDDARKITVVGEEEVLNALISGQTMTINHIATTRETVGDIAAQYAKEGVSAKSILAENAGLDSESPIEEGTEVRITVTRPYIHVVVTWIVEETKEIAFETETRKSNELALNTTVVQQEGEIGMMTLSYRKVSVNGVVVENTFQGDQITKEPVNKIVLEGTNQRTVNKTVNLAGRSITDSLLKEMVQKGDVSEGIPADVISLDLSSNHISDVSPLKTLTGLSELFLSKNGNISNIAPLSGLTKLTKLDLSGNRISDISSLSSLVNLQELNLSNNSISDFTKLKSLTNLKYLDISHNNISGNGNIDKVLNDLKSALPNCEIRCARPND